MKMEVDENDRLVEVIHDGAKYQVLQSVLKEADALLMPDGVFINLNRTGVENILDESSNHCRLVAVDENLEIKDDLPTLNVVRLQDVGCYKPN